jgi:ADP-ribosylglycohydrolase
MESTPTIPLPQRKQGALLGLFVGDALAMPVHWYYSIPQLKKDYGSIQGYTKPKVHMEGSIMNLSNTGGGGRGSDKGEIIGSVINHGKKEFWGRGLNFHYHQSLQAGENTLEGQLARLLIRTIAADGGQVKPESFLAQYVKFMTTPGSHNDTYASTCHRMFFVNYIKPTPPEACADNDNHNTDAIDALTLAIPVIAATVTEEGPSEHVRVAARSVVALTRKSKVLPAWVDVYADMLASIIAGKKTLKEAAVDAGKKIGFDVKQSAEAAWNRTGKVNLDTYVGGDGSDPMVACYIDSSFPAMLHLAYRYADHGPRMGLLANANAGGENVARGSALGALFGAAYGV